MYKNYLFLIVLIILNSLSFSAKNNIDSLKTVLNKQVSKKDTNYLNTAIVLAKELIYTDLAEAKKLNDEIAQLSKKLNFNKGVNTALSISGSIYYVDNKPNEAIKTLLKSIEMCRRTNYKSLLANDLGNIGLIYYFTGNYDSSITCCEESIKLNLEMKDKYNYLSDDYNTIGMSYNAKGNFEKALGFYFKSLKLVEARKDTIGITKAFIKLGMVSGSLRNLDEAEKYFKQARDLSKIINNTQGLLSSLGNLGYIAAEKHKVDEALAYNFEALEIARNTNNMTHIGFLTGNISNMYRDKEDYDNAIKYLNESIEVKTKMNSKSGLAISYHNLALIYERKKNYSKAFEEYHKSLKMAKELGILEVVNQTDLALSNLYAERKDFKNAWEHLRMYVNLKDTLFTQEREKLVAEMNVKYETEKNELKISNLTNEKKINLLEIRKKEDQIKAENKQKFFFAIGFGLTLALAFFIFRGLRVQKKANAIIKKQQKEVLHQKEIVEEKNKEILDSITYAKRIQEAILPPQKLVKQYLNNSFVLYKPKDIVAGDFYWMEHTQDTVLFAAADCTGHGVPGALVSVVCSNALNRSVKEFDLKDPAKILDKVRELVIETFEKSDEEVKDGMDISLCVLNINKKELMWAGANNPLWLIRNKELIEFKADKQPIGKYANQLPFTTHLIKLEDNDCFYIFSDGYADQFGGTEGKKFKTASMKKLLISINDEDMINQRNIINQTFENWRGQLDQLDDVCMIGIRV